MKYTNYFLHTRLRSDRANILDEWINRAFGSPEYEDIQLDGRIRRWVWIPEVEKYLRIILLPDGETIHNAFFDRGFKRGEK